MRRLSLGLALPVLLSLAALAPLSAQNVTELYVTPDTVRLAGGQRQGLTVQAFDDAGNAILAIRYRVGDTTVARIASNGTLTAGRSGRTDVQVQAGKKSRTVTVFVTGESALETAPSAPGEASAPAVVSDVALLEVEPLRLLLLPSEHARLTVRPRRADGTPALAARLSWKSLRPEVLAVQDSTGVITALSTGQGVVQVSAPGGASVSVPVVVTLSEFALDTDRLVVAPGDVDTLVARVTGQGNRALRPTDLQWTVSDPAVLSVSADGVVRAVGAGRAEVIVDGFLQERRLPVIVHQRVAHFLAAPRLTETVRMPLLSSREFALIPQTADSLPVEGVPVSWSVGDTGIARFDTATGRLTALKAGSTTLNFAVRGFQARGWNIEVLPGAIAFAASRAALRAGEQFTLTPSFVDPSGKPVAPATGLEWITSNAGVARVTPEGVVQAVAPGRATISAQGPGGAAAQATILVTGDLLVSSTRGGRFGVYAIVASQPEVLVPVLADSFSNSIDAVYSPDRTRVAFASDRFGAGNFDIFVADADGHNPVRLTTDPGIDVQPAWTADGRHLVFVSSRASARQLYLMDLDGSGVRPLTTLSGGAESPAISPDGRTVAFAGSAAGREAPTDIYTIPLEGGPPTPVTSTRDRRESRPAFLPDGTLTWVLQRRDRKDPDVVQHQGAAGAEPTALMSTDGTLQDLAVSRDGARLAWVASRPAERNRSVPEFTFQWRPLVGGIDTSVRLLPGERITSPAF